METKGSPEPSSLDNTERGPPESFRCHPYSGRPPAPQSEGQGRGLGRRKRNQCLPCSRALPSKLGPSTLTCTHRLPHSFPPPGASIVGVGLEGVSERNHALLLCFRRRCLFSQWATQAGSTHAISSADPHAASTKGYERRQLRAKEKEAPPSFPFSAHGAAACSTTPLG